MKIRTKRFPRSAACRAAVPLVLAWGCHAPAWFAADARNQPRALVGEWVDSSHTTPRDTALWVLEPSGTGLSRHLVHAEGTVTTRRITERHYGHWYVQGALADSVGRRLCFTNRPGRSAATCLAFDLDSSVAGTVRRRRLLVRAYQGEHHLGDRVLLSLAP